MQLVILDWDGVITDSKPPIISAMKTVMEANNIHWKWSDDAAWRLRGLPNFAEHTQFFKALIGVSIGYSNLDEVVKQDEPEEELQIIMDSFLTPDYEEMAVAMDEAYTKIRQTDENVKAEIPFPGSLEAIDMLAGKFKIAVMTNASRIQLDKRLEILGKDFAVVVSRDDVQNKKPAPDGLLKICKELNIDPKEATYIGDSSWDIQAAKAAGCASIALTCGMAGRERLEKENPDKMFENLKEAADDLCK